MKLVNNESLLFGSRHDLTFVKISYESWQINVIQKHHLRLEVKTILMDQLNNNCFILYNQGLFVTGSVDGDQIVYSERREFDFDRLQWTKLVGNQLIGFQISNNRNESEVHSWEFSTVDLVALRKDIINVPFSIKNNQNTQYFAVSLSIFS